jgi:ABC-type multidrug transport system permease subunit
MDWTLEIPWAIGSSVAVAICVSLAYEAVKDRRIARKHEIEGAARELAESSVIHNLWRLVVSTCVCAAAWVSLLFVPLQSYLYTGQYIRNYLWLVVTAAIVLQGLAERRARNRVMAEIQQEHDGRSMAPPFSHS